MASTNPQCLACGYALPRSNPLIPCPNCGAAVSHARPLPQIQEEPRLSLALRQDWPAFLGWLAHFINRLQWVLHRIFAREILLLDLPRTRRFIKTLPGRRPGPFASEDQTPAIKAIR